MKNLFTFMLIITVVPSAVIFFDSLKTYDTYYKTSTNQLMSTSSYACDDGYLFKTGANFRRTLQILDTQGNAVTCELYKKYRK